MHLRNCWRQYHATCDPSFPIYRFSRIDHPRFGLIICVMAKRDLSAGEEILVNYNMDMALAPEWYKVKEYKKFMWILINQNLSFTKAQSKS